MRRTILLALLAVALIAMPAAASVQNIKLSGDVETTWLVRDQFDMKHETAANDFHQNLLITQTRLRVDADLTDNVSATVALINERAWDVNTSASSDVDLNLAYVTLREMLYSPLTVTIGRQEFAFGNSFVIDSAGSNNTADADSGLAGVAEDLSKQTAKDAIRATLDYNPLTIDILYAKIDADAVLGAESNSTDNDVDLIGINANYQLGDSMDTVVEGYFWTRLDQTHKDATTITSGIKTDTIYMPGLRASSNILDGLNLQGEVAWQFGNNAVTAGEIDNVQRQAVAAQVIANYKLPFAKIAEYNPVISSSYTYLSGDSNPAEAGDTAGGNGEDTDTAWDQMYENQGGGTIFNTLADASNLHVVSFGADCNPIEDVTFGFTWYGLWLDKAQPDANGDGETTITVRQPDGTTLVVPTDTDKGLGNEFDFALTYDYTEDVQFGLNYGFFYPGSAIQTFNDGVATQSLISAKVTF